MKKFNQNCEQCERLTKHLLHIRATYPDYYAKPVPALGDIDASLHIIGLAPGLHGANATGRPFTGDHAGILLYATLFKYGFANKAESKNRDDGLRLINCRITNAVKCLPPNNKPLPCEIKICNQYLKEELSCISRNSVILALGTVAHQAVLKAFELKSKDYPFKHHHIHKLESGRYLVDCYHCSRYNTQTKRLTNQMFESVFESIKKLINNSSAKPQKENANMC